MKCPICGKELQKIKSLGEEILTFMEEDNKAKAKFSISFGNKSKVDKLIHGSIEKSGLCESCNKVFAIINKEDF